MNEKYRPEGTPIVFTAATGYENGDGTRTEYSGYYYDTHGNQVTGNTLSSYANTWERIDWVMSDLVTVYYDRASRSADYTVTGKNDNAEKSDASIDVTSGSTKLTWVGGSGDHIFTAMYPKNGFGSPANNTISFNGATGAVSAEIPATQTLRSVSDKYLPQMQYAYMLARKTIAGSSTDHTVHLPFRPAYTAFEFRLQRPATLSNGSTASYKVKSFTITSTSYLAGNFSLVIDGEDPDRGATWSAAPTVATSNPAPSHSVTVTFNGNTGVDLPTAANTYLDFTLLALPININDLTLTLTYTDNTTKSITLKDGANNMSFTACKKYIITNSKAGFDEWEYVLEEIDDITTYGHKQVYGLGFNVKSYKQSKANPSIKKEVAWHIEYKQSNNTYAPTNPNAAFAMSSGSSASGSGSYTTGEDRSVDIVTVNPNYNTEGSGAGLAARAKLASATPLGTENNPHDLSLYDVHGVSHSRTTANSYVVSAPGYYKFPVVYGNAITNNSDNKSAYDPYGSGAPLNSVWTAHSNQNGVYMTPQFRNAVNLPITSPYVLTDVASYISDPEVVIIWQDTQQGDEIIKYGVNDLKLVGSGNNAYIQFYIDKENIHQGNVLIGLRATLSNTPYGRTEGVTAGGATAYNPAKNIIWSWQIWVCEKDLTPITSKNLMPVNLGWVDKSTSAVEKYTNRYNDYRIVQDETGGLTEDFQILQIGDSRTIASNAGGNPFYQWGRKDPITPQSGYRTTNDYTDELSAAGPTYVWTFVNSIPFYTVAYDYDHNHQPDYGRMIRQPWLPLADPVTHSAINGQFYPPTGFAHTFYDRGVTENTNEILANDHMHTHPQTGTSATDRQVRQLASSVFNLWNASVYTSDDFGGSDKYKTVYDPCPPGFCVPTLGTFDGLESATINLISGEGVEFTIGGETFFMAFSGARVFQGTAGGSNTYEVDSYESYGFYWTDAPSAVMHSTSYNTGTGTNNHAGGYFYYQFAKSLRFSSSGADYSPEDNHWGSENQSQRTGFDDVRANAFSIRPIVDPKY